MATIEEINAMPGFSDLTDEAKKIVLKSASDYSSVKESSIPWWRRPGYEFLVPESARSGIAETMRGIINSPISQEAINSPYAEIATFPFKAVDYLINKPIDVAAQIAAYVPGKTAAAISGYSLPRLIEGTQGIKPQDISYGEDVAETVRQGLNVAAPLALGSSISQIKQLFGLSPKTSISTTTIADQIAQANAESKFALRQTIEARQKTVENVQQRIEQAKIAERSQKAATLADLDTRLEKIKATEPAALKAQGEDVIAQIKDQSPGLPIAKKITSQIAAESLTPIEAGLAIQGPKYQADLTGPRGLYWQKMEEARKPLRQSYQEIKKAGEQINMVPIETIGTFDAMLSKGGISERAFPTAGERAAQRLAGAIEEPLPTVRAVGTTQKQRLLSRSDMLDEENQGAAIIETIMSKAKSGPGEAPHMDRAIFLDLLKGVTENPEVSFADLMTVRQRLRGAQRIAKDDIVKYQLGELEKAVTVDMTKGSFELATMLSTIDKEYLQKIVPYYVKGASARTIIDKKNPGAILNSIIGSPSSHDAEALISFKEILGLDNFKRLVTRPYIEDQIKLSFDKTTGQWIPTNFSNRLATLSLEKKETLMGNLVPQLDEFIESVQRSNRILPAIEKQIGQLSRAPGPQARQITEEIRALEQAPKTEYDRIAKSIKDLEKVTRPKWGEISLTEKIPVEKSLSEKIQGRLEHLGSFAGPWMILHGAVNLNLARVVEGTAIALTPIMVSKLMTSKNGLELLTMGANMARSTKNAAILAAKANAIINPLTSTDSSLQDKIQSVVDQMH